MGIVTKYKVQFITLAFVQLLQNPLLYCSGLNDKALHWLSFITAFTLHIAQEKKVPYIKLLTRNRLLCLKVATCVLLRILSLKF